MQTITKQNNLNKQIHQLTKPYRIHKYKSWTYIFSWIGFLFVITGIILSIVINTNPIYSKHNLFSAVWAQLLFGVFSYLTTQGNLMILIYWICFLFFFSSKLFANHFFSVFIWSYANFVMLAYWAIVFPSWISGGSFDNSVIGITTSLIQHLVCPILFNVVMICGSKYPYQTKEVITNYLYDWKLIGWLSLYAIVYLVYVIAINFIPIPVSAFRSDLQNNYTNLNGHNFISVYGSFTNFNINCWNTKYDENLNLVFDTNTGGHTYNIGFVFGILVFYELLAFLTWISNNMLCVSKKTRKELRKQVKNKTIQKFLLKEFKK
ncbi:MAG: hypothetical protein L3I91_01765 [Mycoplasma sp.]